MTDIATSDARGASDASATGCGAGDPHTSAPQPPLPVQTAGNPSAGSPPSPTPAVAQSAAGGFSDAPASFHGRPSLYRSTLEQRVELAHQMRALIEAEKLTIGEAAVKLGIGKISAHGIAGLIGLRSHPEAVQRRRVTGAQSPKTLAFRAQAVAQAVKADQPIIEMRRAGKTYAEISAALGVSASRITIAVRRSGEATRGTKKTAEPHPSRRDLRRAQDEAIVGQLRDLLAQRMSFAAAVERLGLSGSKSDRLRREYGLRALPGAPKAVVHPRQVVRRIPEWTRQPSQPRAPLAPPNPYRTPAQQEQIAAQKMVLSAKFQPTRQRVPPPANADELIRQALAEGRVTKCPPRCVEAVNNGRGL